MKAFFERLKAKGKPGKVALVAIIVFLPDLLAFGKAAWMASQVFPRAALPRSSKTWPRRSIWPRVSWQCFRKPASPSSDRAARATFGSALRVCFRRNP